jgi:hypothetical protein
MIAITTSSSTKVNAPRTDFPFLSIVLNSLGLGNTLAKFLIVN